MAHPGNKVKPRPPRVPVHRRVDHLYELLNEMFDELEHSNIDKGQLDEWRREAKAIYTGFAPERDRR